MSQLNLTIRRAEPDDYRALRDVHAQPRAIWGTLQLPFPSAEAWRKRLETQPDTLCLLVACIDDRVVGTSGLSVGAASPRRRHVGEIGMVVHDDWQRRGVGHALLGAIVDLADNWFNLLRIELTVYADNAAAISLYERYDFVVEGRLRQFAFREGEYVDALAMARLRGPPAA